MPDPSAPLPKPTEVKDISPDLPPNAENAYNACLEFEQASLKSDNSEAVMSARVLGYLLLHAPKLPHMNRSEALVDLVDAILSCNADHEALFQTYKSRTPPASGYTSRSERSRALLDVSMEETPKDHFTAKAQALKRDGYKCQISGWYDTLVETVLDLPSATLTEFGWVVLTRCAHIVPAPTYFNARTDDANGAQFTQGSGERDYVAVVLAVMKCWGYDVDKLNGANVHSLTNVITQINNVQDRFDELNLWLEATDTPNQYLIQVSHPGYCPPGRSLVTFTTPDPVHLPLPSADLIALHATCAKVACLSGVVEFLCDVERKLEGMSVLESDGSSAKVLRYAIAGIVGEGVPKTQRRVYMD
ncbi:hypothetical protein ONZ45_g18838 [Pleurotus djamor]|nr:hypothetical protein ONZ45_g18838 [Pleurotus djamor]